MTIARTLQVDPTIPMHYHIVSRCVRQKWLCGTDPETNQNYEHRKKWIQDRLLRLGQVFAVNIHAYAIMSNHFHMVLLHDPTACQSWCPEEVAWRWHQAHPAMRNGMVDLDETERRRKWMLELPQLIERRRRKLGSLSEYMKCLKQPIAVRANQEDGCKGHFFEQRFYSGALLNERMLLSAMVYVELNPSRAGMIQGLSRFGYTSFAHRQAELSRDPNAAGLPLRSLTSGNSTMHKSNQCGRPILLSHMSESQYLRMVQSIQSRLALDLTLPHNWHTDFAQLKAYRRVYGDPPSLKAWVEKRNQQWVWKPKPPTIH